MLIKPIDFLDEVWLPITGVIVPNIKENFYIASNYGFVSNIDYPFHHKIYSPKYCGQFNNRAYVNMTSNIGKGLICVISRIVAKLFCDGYVPGLEVNHLDGNPKNDYYKNLEWSTRSENIRHAYDNDLMHTIVSEDIVHVICALLQEDKLSASEIAYVTGLDKLSNNPIALISAIKKKKLWCHISQYYVFPQGRHGRVFSDEQINSICEILQENPKISMQEIIGKLGITIEDESDYIKYRNTISAIRCHRKYTYISCNYSF